MSCVTTVVVVCSLGEDRAVRRFEEALVSLGVDGHETLTRVEGVAGRRKAVETMILATAVNYLAGGMDALFLAFREAGWDYPANAALVMEDHDDVMRLCRPSRRGQIRPRDLDPAAPLVDAAADQIEELLKQDGAHYAMPTGTRSVLLELAHKARSR